MSDYTLEITAKLLCHTSLFKGISAGDMLRILPSLRGRVYRVKPMEIYHSEGEKINRVGVVFTGNLLVCKIHKEGWVNLIEKLAPSYMISVDVACTPSRINPYRVYSAEGADVFDFAFDSIYKPGRIPEGTRLIILQNIMLFLANQNIRKQYKIDALCVNSLRERILTYLETRSAKLGSDQFEIPFNREEMANYLCVNRSALSHELSLMRGEGLIDFQKNHFRIIR